MKYFILRCADGWFWDGRHFNPGKEKKRLAFPGKTAAIIHAGALPELGITDEVEIFSQKKKGAPLQGTIFKANKKRREKL